MAKASKKYHVALQLSELLDKTRGPTMPRSQQYEQILRRLTPDTVIRALQARLDASPEQAACFVRAQKDTKMVSLTIEAQVVDHLEEVALAFRLPAEHVIKLALEDYLQNRGVNINEGLEKYAALQNISETEI